MLPLQSVLSFYQIGIIGSSDFGFIEVSRDNKNFTRIGVTIEAFYPQWQDHSADSGDWRLKIYNLGSYAGDTIIIRFTLTSDAGNTRDGWYLDDINVTSSPSTVEQDAPGIPTGMKLEQNYPNPFNPTTQLSFVIGQSSLVSLKVYDMIGREIATLVNEKLEPGAYNASWNATGIPSGVYYYRLQTAGGSEIKKMILMR